MMDTTPAGAAAAHHASPRPPRPRSVLLVWVATAFAVSLAIWQVDTAFYGRFHLVTGELPSWDFWSALRFPVVLLPTAVVAGLWVWPKRWPVLGGVVALVLIASTAASTAWANHEAARAARGEAVAPNINLPFGFGADPMRMLVLAGSFQHAPPEGWPEHVMVLRRERSAVFVYDPATALTWRFENRDVAFRAGGSTR